MQTIASIPWGCALTLTGKHVSFCYSIKHLAWRSALVVALGLSLAPFVSANLTAQEVENTDKVYDFYQPNNPPWGSSETKDGFIVTIVKTAFDRTRIPYREIFVPWKRGQYMVARTANGFLAPITRLEERENKYQWVAPVNISKLHLVTSNDALASTDWHSLRTIPVVARMASPAQYLLEDLGFQDITLLENEKQAVRMLMANRVLLWMQRGLPGNWAYHNMGGNTRDLKQVHSWDTPLQYLIASHGIPDEVILKLNKTLTSMRMSGEIDRIKGSYFPFPISCDLLFKCSKVTTEEDAKDTTP